MTTPTIEERANDAAKRLLYLLPVPEDAVLLNSVRAHNIEVIADAIRKAVQDAGRLMCDAALGAPVVTGEYAVGHGAHQTFEVLHKKTGRVVAVCGSESTAYTECANLNKNANLIAECTSQAAKDAGRLMAVGNRAPYAAQDDKEMIAAAVAFERESAAWGVRPEDVGGGGVRSWCVTRKCVPMEAGFTIHGNAQVRAVFLRRIMAVTAALDVLRANATKSEAEE